MSVHVISHDKVFSPFMKVVLTLSLSLFFFSVLPSSLAYAVISGMVVLTMIAILRDREERNDFSVNRATKVVKEKKVHVHRQKPTGFVSPKEHQKNIIKHTTQDYTYKVLLDKETKKEDPNIKKAIESRARHDLEKEERIPAHRLGYTTRTENPIHDIPLHLTLDERLKILMKKKHYYAHKDKGEEEPSS